MTLIVIFQGLSLELVPISLFVIVAFHELEMMAYKVPSKLFKYSDNHVPYVLHNSTGHPVFKYQVAAGLGLR